MSRPQRSGVQGEATVEAMLVYEGWTILDRQVRHKTGHKVDIVAVDPAGREWLIEVKVWAHDGGKDTVKKALADAWDLWAYGEDRPYMLCLSHRMVGLHADMLRRAVDHGAIDSVRIIGWVDQL